MTDSKSQELAVGEDEMAHEEARRRIQKYREDPNLHELSFATNTEEGKARIEVFFVQLQNIKATCISVDDLAQTHVFIDIKLAEKFMLLDTRGMVAKTK